MSVHCSLETLSAYVDAELSDAELESVEAHVAECSPCRDRVSGLESVVGSLKRLEQVAVPPTLAPDLELRVRRERARLPLSARLEDEMRRATRQPILAPLFALVVAFGVILYLFSLGVSMRARSGTQVVIGAAEHGDVESMLADEETRETGSGEDAPEVRALQRAPAAGADVPVTPAGRESRRLAGRTFVLRQGVWTEEAIGDRLPEARLDVGAGASLPSDLEPLRGMPGVYRVLDGRTVVEVVVPPPAAK